MITDNAANNRLIVSRGDDILEGYFGADILKGEKATMSSFMQMKQTL